MDISYGQLEELKGYLCSCIDYAVADSSNMGCSLARTSGVASRLMGFAEEDEDPLQRSMLMDLVHELYTVSSSRVRTKDVKSYKRPGSAPSFPFLVSPYNARKIAEAET